MFTGIRSGCLCAVVIITGFFLGCVHTGNSISNAAAIRNELRKPLTRAEREQLLRPKGLSSIGEMANIVGLEPQEILGFGLVTGLGDRGGDSTNIDWHIRNSVRKTLVREEGRTFEESGRMLRSMESSIVQVKGVLQPGTSYGDRFDVILRPLDNATSLENGFLHTAALRRVLVLKDRTIPGEIVALARGEVTAWTGVGKSVVADAGKSRIGIVFDGGRSKAEWVFFIQMHKRYVSGKRTVLIELLLNRRFSKVGLEAGASPVNYAKAVSNRTVELHVPPVYRKFATRFADVVKSIRGSYYYGPPSVKEMNNLAKRLETGKPEDKYLASVILEGIGNAATGYLEKVKGDDWTTLYSGEALCYLNSNLGRTRIIAACNSSVEQIRYKAVKFLSNLSGRTVTRTLRAKVLDPSDRISIEAIKGLMGRGDEYAKRTHVSGFDLIAVPGVDAGLIVNSTGRPIIAVTGKAMPLQGTVELRLDGIGIGSTDSAHVGIITSLGPVAETITVKATIYDILAALARHNPSFETVKKVIAALEDADNLPYKVTWIE